ncbi:putative MFS-type transporter [Psilocybe cubensis]|uniref:MFS-type transporter n=1 Tax=Psilocybe cubensis TaxID=181762 RepID=A0ACB8GRM4_PSICU|nr:putative MFS-type transporter [Psilocybe cubensis]KAH9477694.1 putative MFS-type transporter [Psilocybe cubensis]
MQDENLNDSPSRASASGSDEKYSEFTDQIDIYTLHELHAGRLILDPLEAKKELGDSVAAKLKLTKDGRYVLWPQPTDDPEDPQNWSDRKKNFQLFIVILASIIPDFDNGIGWGGIFFVMLMRRYGRLATLFWTQLIALGLLAGATFAPTLQVFAAMRSLTAFFGTCPQVTGLYTITDLFPFHLQARKINYWTMAVVLSPHLSPFLFGFLDARTTWRWAYGVGCLYGLAVLILIALFLDESLYHRKAYSADHPPVHRRKGSIVQRVKDVVGITGVRQARSDPPWSDICTAILKIAWRPHLFLILFFEAFVFGFSIGINVTITVFFQTPPPFGFGFSQTTVSAIYATPVVAVFIGELLGRYLNDWFMRREIKRNNGVFEAETRLWYLHLLLYWQFPAAYILN